VATAGPSPDARTPARPAGRRGELARPQPPGRQVSARLVEV